MQSFKNQGVLITGAGRGIGKRLALGFAAAGARLGLLARSKAELDLTHLEIQHGGAEAIRLRADVRDYEQVSTAVDRMIAHFGRIDVLICAAGIQGPVGPLAECREKDWADTIAVNLLGSMHACRAVLPHMQARRSGKIILFGGGGGAKPRPYFSAYAASKAAVARFTETLAQELAADNIQVNCMAPGGTYTHMIDEILRAGDLAGAKDRKDALQVRLTGGVAPEKQIELAMFLASEKSNHVTGKLVHVNDDWRRLEQASIHPELYTLRRVQKV